jgi:enterochelin esterase-like enzyme
MPVAAKRTQVWLTTLGDWRWPGAPQPPDIAPPSWVPSLPPAREPALALGGVHATGTAHAGAARVGGVVGAPGVARRRILARRLALGAAASALAAALATAALGGPRALERLIGEGGSTASPPAATAGAQTASEAAPLPTLVPVSTAAAGSAIDHANYRSLALGKGGSFYVYLPPGFGADAQRYPVVYLLPGYKQAAGAFLQMGLQRTLDRLIAAHRVPPMIAVVIAGGPGAHGWQRVGMERYESYVVEVQALIDRMLPTVAQRGARAIAGDSLGGYGAMRVALDNPYRFGVVESWLSFFNGLRGRLHAARPVIETLGLHAFIYGAASDRIADPAQNLPFAAALRAAGADARGAVYHGEHSVQTIEEHLARGLTFAGRSLVTAGAGATS